MGGDIIGSTALDKDPPGSLFHFLKTLRTTSRCYSFAKFSALNSRKCSHGSSPKSATLQICPLPRAPADVRAFEDLFNDRDPSEWMRNNCTIIYCGQMWSQQVPTSTRIERHSARALRWGICLPALSCPSRSLGKLFPARPTVKRPTLLFAEQHLFVMIMPARCLMKGLVVGCQVTVMYSFVFGLVAAVRMTFSRVLASQFRALLEDRVHKFWHC